MFIVAGICVDLGEKRGLLDHKKRGRVGVHLNALDRRGYPNESPAAMVRDSRPLPTGWPALGHEEAQIPTSDHPELLLGGCTAIPGANLLSVTHTGQRRRFVSPLL